MKETTSKNRKEDERRLKGRHSECIRDEKYRESWKSAEREAEWAPLNRL